MENQNENLKKGKGTIIVIIILVLLVLGLGGYIVYDKMLTKENTKTNEPEKTEKKIEEQPKLLTNEEALEIGKKLYLKARDNVYKHIGTVLGVDTNICYSYINNQMQEQNCDTVDQSNVYYKVSNKEFKNNFTQNGINQFEKFMTTEHAGKFVIYNNDYYIFGNLGGGQYTVDEDSTKITINEIEENAITFDVVETCVYANNQYVKQIATTFKIVKENNTWKIDDYTDALHKYAISISSGN